MSELCRIKSKLPHHWMAMKFGLEKKFCLGLREKHGKESVGEKGNQSCGESSLKRVIQRNFATVHCAFLT